jgi:hypothetical protein
VKRKAEVSIRELTAVLQDKDFALEQLFTVSTGKVPPFKVRHESALVSTAPVFKLVSYNIDVLGAFELVITNCFKNRT